MPAWGPCVGEERGSFGLPGEEEEVPLPTHRSLEEPLPWKYSELGGREISLGSGISKAEHEGKIGGLYLDVAAH